MPILCALFLFACNKPTKQYECEPGDSRQCKCLSATTGTQECSRGPLHTNWKPRTWVPCSCCWEYFYDDLGLNKKEKNDTSGCWSDAYNPSTPTYDTGKDTNGSRRLSDGEKIPGNHNKDY